MMRAIWVFVLALGLLVAPARACGVEADCMVGDRTYRIAMPEAAATGPFGALVYAHGYRGSAAAAMRNTALRDLAHENGLAFVATKSAGIDWLIPGVPADPSATGEAEFNYYDAVIDDLVARHGIDRTRLIATGFSAGGMMVWNLACNRGASFAAFIPIAGTFWAPVPTGCPSAPVNLVHVHGTSDKIVPLSGRAIQTTHQGNVFSALELMGAEGRYGDRRPAPQDGELTCAQRLTHAGKTLAFCTHPGGHSLKAEYLRTALSILRANGGWPPAR